MDLRYSNLSVFFILPRRCQDLKGPSDRVLSSIFSVWWTGPSRFKSQLRGGTGLLLSKTRCHMGDEGARYRNLVVGKYQTVESHFEAVGKQITHNGPGTIVLNFNKPDVLDPM